MGWWNDLIVEDVNLRQGYDDVSGLLFRSALAAFESVLESSQASPRHRKPWLAGGAQMDHVARDHDPAADDQRPV